MRLRPWPTLIGALAISALSAPAYGQFSPKEAVGVRINGYRETGAAFKTLNDQLKQDAPLKVMLRTSARRIAQTAHDQYGWFPSGSGLESGEKTKAKPAIWTDAAGFKVAQDNFQRQADLMSKAVDGGDVGQTKAAVRALGEACAACHNKFRERE